MTDAPRTLTFYHIDAFTDEMFAGNPAAVYVLDGWLPDPMLQAIAAEHNLSETAFLVPGDSKHELRWFTPDCEVELCGHATLASAHVLLRCLDGFTAPLTFTTRHAGDLGIREANGLIWMDFPSESYQTLNDDTATLNHALGAHTTHWFYSQAANLAVFEHAEQVASLAPDMHALAQRCSADHRLLIATAPADDGRHGFVSRVFAPGFGVDEDPVTGSAHCTLAPYWAERLGKTRLAGRQISARGGTVICEVAGDRVHLGGQAATFATGTANLPATGARR